MAAFLIGSDVGVDWQLSPGATHYNVYMAQTPGDEGNRPIAIVTSQSFRMPADLRRSPVYYFQVAGVGPGGVGARSAEASSRARFMFRPLTK